MKIQPLTFGDVLWASVAEYAHNCSWGAGKILSKQMLEDEFNDLERVFVAIDDSNIAGYCTFAATDCIPDVSYTPYISFVFVGEEYRGKRLGEKMICCALKYAKELGFDSVYLVSDHENLYEKYGFIKVDEKPAPWNPDTFETIFMHLT